MAFRWSQNPSSITITFPVPPTTKKTDIDVNIVNTSMRAGVKGSVPLCDGQLTSPVKGFKWSLKNSVVSIQLEKMAKTKWQDLLVPGRKARVLFEYASRDPVELSIQVGEIITILNEDSSGWWKGDLNGKIGLFPCNFAEIIEANSVPEGPEEIEQVAPVQTQPAYIPPVQQQQQQQQQQQPPQQQATYTQPSFVSAQPPPPAVVDNNATAAPRVALMSSNGAMAELKNRLANRSNTVTSLEEATSSRTTAGTPPPPAITPTQSSTPPPGKISAKLQPIAVGRALYDYSAVEEGELSFKQGSRVDILVRDDSGWWQGVSGDTVGWFPADYVTEVKDVAPTPVSVFVPAPPTPAPAPTPVVSAPAPAPVPVPAPVSYSTPAPPVVTPAQPQEYGEEDDDIIDISNVGSTRERLVVPRRPMGSSIRRAPSKSFRKSTISQMENEENYEEPTVQKPAARLPANTMSTARAKPPGLVKAIPTKALPPAPAAGGDHPTPAPPPLLRTAEPAPTPVFVSRPPPPSFNPHSVSPPPPSVVSPPPEEEPVAPVQEDQPPPPPKSAFVKRPPPPAGPGKPKIAPRKVAPAPRPEEPADTPASISPSPVSTPVIPSGQATVTKVLGSRPPIPTSVSLSSVPSSEVPVERMPVRTGSSNALSSSSSSVTPPASFSPAISPSISPAATPPPPSTTPPRLKATRPPPPKHMQTAEPAPPPVVAPTPLYLSSSSVTSTKWPQHLGTFQEFCDHLTSLLSDTSSSLSPRTRKHTSVGVCTVDGHVFVHGGERSEREEREWSERGFTLGAASAPFVYCAAAEAVGVLGLRKITSADGTLGDSFSESPHPFSTAGSIAMSGKLLSSFSSSNQSPSFTNPPPTAQASNKLLNLLSSLAGHRILPNISHYFTSRASSHNSIALSHYLKSIGSIDERVSAADALDVHLTLQAVEVDAKTGSAIAATIAGNGISPLSQKQLIPAEIASTCVSLLPKITLSGEEVTGWNLGNTIILIFPNVAGIVVHTDDASRAQNVATVIAQKLNLIS